MRDNVADYRIISEARLRLTLTYTRSSYRYRERGDSRCSLHTSIRPGQVTFYATERGAGHSESLKKLARRAPVDVPVKHENKLPIFYPLILAFTIIIVT